jgi:hypothetical protein
MGTIGGKVGFVVGVVVAFACSEPMLKTTCPSFFEEGGGTYDTPLFALAAAMSVIAGVAAGLLVRLIVNRLLRPV